MNIAKTPLILVATAALGIPAVAAEPGISGHPARVNVSFADLDLESTEGRALLERRLMRAVKAVCSPAPLAEGLFVEAERARCIEATSADLADKVDAAVRAARANRLASAAAGRR